MLTSSVENMLVTSIGRTLETGAVPTQYIVIISTVRRQCNSGSRKLLFSVGSILVRLLISLFLANKNWDFNTIIECTEAIHVLNMWLKFHEGRFSGSGEITASDRKNIALKKTCLYNNIE